VFGKHCESETDIDLSSIRLQKLAKVGESNKSGEKSVKWQAGRQLEYVRESLSQKLSFSPKRTQTPKRATKSLNMSCFDVYLNRKQL
jgi:hypothetical protein